MLEKMNLTGARGHPRRRDDDPRGGRRPPAAADPAAQPSTDACHLSQDRTDLGRAFSVGVPDLYGYGNSAKAAGGGDHAVYSSRAKTGYQVALERLLGHERARASIDLDHERSDADRGIEAPLLTLWGADGTVEELYDVLKTGRDEAIDVCGRALRCGTMVA